MSKNISDELWLEYFRMFNEDPPLVSMRMLKDEQKIDLIKKAIDRGSPIVPGEDYALDPDDALWEEYFKKFDESPPLLYMQGFTDEEKIELIRKAIERGSPLDEKKDFGPFPEDAEIF